MLIYTFAASPGNGYIVKPQHSGHLYIIPLVKLALRDDSIQLYTSPLIYGIKHSCPQWLMVIADIYLFGMDMTDNMYIYL